MTGIGTHPTILDHLDGRRVEIEPTAAAVLLTDHEARLLKHGQMVHHRNAADIEMLCQFSHRTAGIGFQYVEDLPPALMGECVENSRHVLISNHVITKLHIKV
ncbi:hypothetical protein L53_01360 [Hyphomonas sp. L-53-1-40]|nr:hypothetical protein L53_01360 [Hyphomonas sp. L-53-1-40]